MVLGRRRQGTERNKCTKSIVTQTLSFLPSLPLPFIALRGLHINGERYYVTAAFDLEGFVCSKIWKDEDGRKSTRYAFAKKIFAQVGPYLGKIGEERRVVIVNDIEAHGGVSIVDFVCL